MKATAESEGTVWISEVWISEVSLHTTVHTVQFTVIEFSDGNGMDYV